MLLIDLIKGLIIFLFKIRSQSRHRWSFTCTIYFKEILHEGMCCAEWRKYVYVLTEIFHQRSKWLEPQILVHEYMMNFSNPHCNLLQKSIIEQEITRWPISCTNIREHISQNSSWEFNGSILLLRFEFLVTFAFARKNMYNISNKHAIAPKVQYPVQPISVESWQYSFTM